jgi:hypothetical protein
LEEAALSTCPAHRKERKRERRGERTMAVVVDPAARLLKLEPNGSPVLSLVSEDVKLPLSPGGEDAALVASMLFSVTDEQVSKK